MKRKGCTSLSTEVPFTQYIGVWLELNGVTLHVKIILSDHDQTVQYPEANNKKISHKYHKEAILSILNKKIIQAHSKS